MGLRAKAVGLTAALHFFSVSPALPHALPFRFFDRSHKTEQQLQQDPVGKRVADALKSAKESLERGEDRKAVNRRLAELITSIAAEFYGRDLHGPEVSS